MNKNILEGTVLLAEFTGWKAARKDSSYWHPINSRRYYSVNGMLFNKSWQWLIPAWTKLYCLFISLDRSKQERRRNDAMNFVDRFGLMVNKNDIGAAFQIMIEALQWYNTQKT